MVVHFPATAHTEQQPLRDRDRSQVARGSRKISCYAAPSSPGQRPPTDTKHQGPSQVSEEPATVSIEDLEIDDIVIAYVI